MGKPGLVNYDTEVGVKTLPVTLGESITKGVLKGLAVILHAAVVGLGTHRKALYMTTISYDVYVKSGD